MTQRVGSTAVLAACIALVLGACGVLRPTAISTNAPVPTKDTSVVNPRYAPIVGEWEGITGVAYTMDLPDGWYDYTAELKADRPDTVLTSVFSVGDNLNADTAFATVSTHQVVMDSSPMRSVFDDLAEWEARMTDATFGPRGGIQTDLGGAGWWGSVTGMKDGELTTIHSIHIYHDTYELMVLIESYAGEEALAEDLLASLETVEFTAPAPIVGRHGVPEEVDGRWQGYCGLVSADVQDWDYDFDPTYDSTPWSCPEMVDYLGAWQGHDGPRLYTVTARLEVGLSEAELRQKRSIPTGQGATLVSDAGYTFLVENDQQLPLNAGGTVSRIDLVVTTPDGYPAPMVTYLIDLGVEGTVHVNVSANDGEPAGDLEWVEPFLASIRAEG